MTARTDALAARRALLLARSAALRDDLASQSTGLAHSLGYLDRGVAFARSGKLRPVITLAALALLLLRPRAVWRLASRGAVLVPLARRLLPGIIARVRDYRARKRSSGE